MLLEEEMFKLKYDLQQLKGRKENLEAKYMNAHDGLSREFYSWKRAQEEKIKTLTDRVERLTIRELDHLKYLEEELKKRQKQFDFEHGEIWKRYEADQEVREVKEDIKHMEGQLRLCELRGTCGIQVPRSMDSISSSPNSKGKHDWNKEVKDGKWWQHPFWQEKQYLDFTSFVDDEVAIALFHLKKVFDERWFKRQQALRLQKQHYLVSLLQGFDVTDALIELGIDLAIAEKVPGSARLIKRLKESSEYFTARFQLEILASLRRDFRDLQSEPRLPNGGQADAIVTVGEEQVYFEITFLQPPYKLSTEIPNALEKVKKEIEKSLMDSPWKIRVRLLSFPENSDIQHLVDELRRIESTPASLRWTWAEIDISGKRLTERITRGATVQVAGPPFSEGERMFDKVIVKGKQLHPNKPGFVIIRPTLPAVNVSLAEIEIRKALKELQPPCLLTRGEHNDESRSHSY